ncbi:MAG: hypothetical protein RRC34_10735 [Lentisphaeria bacterium]|nr:hypothetical protein [Lentisphaeria bacterium]
MPVITADSFTDIYYSSFFFAGFQELAATGKCVLKTWRGAPRVHVDGGGNPFHAILLFSARDKEKETLFCIDTRDQSDWEHGYHKELLKACDHYFKVNFRPEVIDMTRPGVDKIHPVPIFFPVRPMALSALFPRPFPCQEAGWTMKKIMRRLTRMGTLPAMTFLTASRQTAITHDIVFAVRFYGEHRHAAEDARRRRLIEGLRNLPGRKVLAGFVSKNPMPTDYEALRIPGFTLKGYMKALSGSRVCIYIRGLHDCLSFKLGQLLAMGKPIVGERILNNRDFYYSHPGINEQFAFDSVEDILAAVENRLEQPAILDRHARLNRALFDEKLSPATVCQNILDTCQSLGRTY